MTDAEPWADPFCLLLDEVSLPSLLPKALVSDDQGRFAVISGTFVTCTRLNPKPLQSNVFHIYPKSEAITQLYWWPQNYNKRSERPWLVVAVESSEYESAKLFLYEMPKGYGTKPTLKLVHLLDNKAKLDPYNSPAKRDPTTTQSRHHTGDPRKATATVIATHSEDVVLDPVREIILDPARESLRQQMRKSEEDGNRKVHFVRGIAHSLIPHNDVKIPPQNTLFLGLSTGKMFGYELINEGKDLALKKKVIMGEFKAPVSDVVVAKQDPKIIAACDENGDVRVWNNQGKVWIVIYHINTGSDIPMCLQITSDLLIIGHSSGKIELHSVTFKTKSLEVYIHSGSIKCLEIHPTINVFISVAEDNRINITALPGLLGEYAFQILAMSVDGWIAGASFTNTRPDTPDFTLALAERPYLLQYTHRKANVTVKDLVREEQELQDRLNNLYVEVDLHNDDDDAEYGDDVEEQND